MSQLGLDAKLFRNTGTYATPSWTEIGNVRDVTLTLEKGEADVTTRANGGWRATLATLKDASVEFQMVWDTGDAGFAAVRDAYLNNTPLDMAVMSGAMSDPDAEGLRAEFDVFSFTRNEPLEEGITVSVTLKPTYSANAPQWITGGP